MHGAPTRYSGGVPGIGGGGENKRAAVERVRELLTDLDDADLEILDPPDDVWAGIEAALASDRQAAPRVAPTRDRTPRLVVEYRIDVDDVVVDVGESWAEFANDNGAPELAIPAPGRTLWSHMAGGDIRALWRLLVARVRATGLAAEVPFRCDGPEARRWFEMTVTPEADGHVAFRSVLVFEEVRAEMTLLAMTAERVDRAPVALCAWCGRGEHDGRWHELEDVVRLGRLLEDDHVPPVEAGVCGDCRSDMRALLTGLGVTETSG